MTSIRKLQAVTVAMLLALAGACIDTFEDDEAVATEAYSLDGPVYGGPVLCGVALAKKWTAPVKLSVANGQLWNSTAVAASADGSAVAVWLEYAGSNRYRLKASRFDFHPGSWLRTWQADADLLEQYVYDASGNYSVVAPHVAADASGNAVAVWVRYNQSTFEVRARRFSAATGSWSSTAVLATSPFYAPPAVDLASDDAGNVVVVWEHQHNQALTSVYHRRYDPGQGWLPAAALESSWGPAGSPDIAASSTGAFVAAWTQVDVERSVYARRYTQAGGWGAIVRVDTPFDQLGAASPNVAMNNNGEAAVTWTGDTQTTGVDVVYNRMNAAGGWSGAVLLASGVEGNPWVIPQVTVEDGGNGVVTWSHDDGGGSNVYARRVLPGGVPDSVTAKLDTGSSPLIGLGDSGSGIAAWREHNGSAVDIRAARLVHRRRDRNCPESWSWSAPTVVDSEPLQAGAHALAAFPYDDAVAVWKQLESNGTMAVYASRYARRF